MKNNLIAKDNADKLAMHISNVSIAINTVLSVAKLFAGIFAHSGAMISDAVHSASDVLSTFVVIIGVKLAGREADADHEYGHERLECVASLILAVMLFLTGCGIGLSGIKQLISGKAPETPGIIALVAALVSIAVKEWMFRYTKNGAQKINSGALMADAWHHRSDALSSVGAFVGILGARLGFTLADCLASIIISLFIVKAAYDIFKDATDKMVDHSCDVKTESEIRRVCEEQIDVLHIDSLKTRLFGSRIYVDVEIAADAEKTLEAAHLVAERVHDAIEREFPLVKHCMVHVNPFKEIPAEE